MSRLRPEEIAAAARSPDGAAVLGDLLAELAEVVAEQLGSPAAPAALEEGEDYELMIRVRATVVEASDGAYRLELDARQFMGGRGVTVDAEEIARATRLTDGRRSS